MRLPSPLSAMLALAIATAAGAAEQPTGAAPDPDTVVVLDDTSLWRQFQVMGSHHIRSTDGNLFPGRIKHETGSYSNWGFSIAGPSSGAACRHARKEGESAGDASSYMTFCTETSQLPPADWTGLAMDDSLWPRVWLPQPVPAAGWSGNQSDSLGSYNPYDTVLLLARSRFEVDAPSRVKACMLSLDYWGGVVVYVNGQEVARDHMPGKKPDLASPAVDYPEGAFLTPQGKVLVTTDETNRDRLALRNRKLSEVKIPAGLLRKGVNVLAIETHAAPVNSRVFTDKRDHNQGWPPIGLLSVRLAVSPAGTAVASRSRPRGIQVWNAATCDTLSVFDYGIPADPLCPILVRAARNSVFSGRLMVGSDQPLRGLRVSVSDLTHEQSGATIPTSAMRARYAVATEAGKSWVRPGRFDGLLDAIPAEIPVASAQPPALGLYHFRAAPKLVAGAVAPLWFTVRVPRDIKPGVYDGRVSVSADGLKPTTVPLRVEVCDWAMPDPKDFCVQNFLYHAEEVEAKYYGVPNYSDKHLELVGKSLSIMAEANSRQVQANLAINYSAYVPASSNPESLVRWVKQPDGSFKHDYAHFDRYLDMVAKSVGTPNTLRLNCWGSYDRWDNPCMSVAVLDPATGALSSMPQPAVGTPESLAFWKPVFPELLKRLKARGWLDDTTLGHNAHASEPKPEVVQMAHALWPDGEWSWTSHGASQGKNFVGTDKNVVMTVRHADGVWGHAPRGALPGTPRRNTFTNICRNVLGDNSPLREYRRLVELCAVNRGYDGVSELGVDLFPLKKSVGGYGLPPAGRGTGWAGQGSFVAILYPGPDGPVATERFEMFREGVELCEAVLFLRRVVADKKLDAALQQRLERYLRQRDRTIQGDFVPRFMQIEEDKRLLDLAGETARELQR